MIIGDSCMALLNLALSDSSSYKFHTELELAMTVNTLNWLTAQQIHSNPNGFRRVKTVIRPKITPSKSRGNVRASDIITCCKPVQRHVNKAGSYMQQQRRDGGVV